ncbi:hypothetical protein Tco_1451593 [Tanacetum coccineum]
MNYQGRAPSLFANVPAQSLSPKREEPLLKIKMAEMFGILKELMTSKAPKKVLIKEKAKSPITKNVNSISLARGEEERNDDNGVATRDDTEKTYRNRNGNASKGSQMENEAENRIKKEPIRKARKEETTEAPSSQPVEY